MSDQNMAGNTGDGMTGQDPDMTGDGMGAGTSTDKPSQAEGDMGDDEMSGTESGSSGGTSGTPTTS
jgi:hypothetical protein